jgi:hypothetical protein
MNHQSQRKKNKQAAEKVKNVQNDEIYCFAKSTKTVQVPNPAIGKKNHK